MNFRIGHGFDVHALAEGLPLIMGGIELLHTKGCVAHSDGDVVIHAICDSLLGAAALGDIGLHFPDTSSDFKGIDSKILLSRTVELLRTEGYSIGNIDCTISMQRPKLRPHIDAMRQTLAAVIGIDVDSISIKATTTEKLGFEGREEGVSTTAVSLIYRT
ncbi:MAG: 2-C-methyl-D-erythritol 2,4-cyclodiphosphate synthase [Rikenellaceae bacterium]